AGHGGRPPAARHPGPQLASHPPRPVGARLASPSSGMNRIPGIAFRGSDWDRRAWVIGTGLDVWEIVEIFKDYGEIEPMVADSHLTERQVKLALAYYGEYPEAIDAALRDNRRS